MHRIQLAFIVFILFTNASRAQSSPSKFYDPHGNLIADPAFSISKVQLMKWSLAEEIIIDRILCKPGYISVNEGDYEHYIFSFTIDSTGKFNDVQYEKYETLYKVPLEGHLKSISLEAIQSIQMAGRKNIIKSYIKSERYYMPILYIGTIHPVQSKVKNGWLTEYIDIPITVED